MNRPINYFNWLDKLNESERNQINIANKSPKKSAKNREISHEHLETITTLSFTLNLLLKRKTNLFQPESIIAKQSVKSPTRLTIRASYIDKKIHNLKVNAQREIYELEYYIPNPEKKLSLQFRLTKTKKGEKRVTMLTFTHHYNEGICPWRRVRNEKIAY